MSRRVGQNGNVFVKSKCKLGRCDHQKGLCPKYGRYWKDQPGQHERLRVVVSLGECYAGRLRNETFEITYARCKLTPRKRSSKSHRQPPRSRSKRSGGSTKCVRADSQPQEACADQSQPHWQATKPP